MSPFDSALLAQRSMAVERHLRRVADRLPSSAAELQPADASDAVVQHLGQATQIVIDLAMAACLSLKLGTPASYADAFRLLEKSGVIDSGLADRLVRAAGFRNIVAMDRVTRSQRYPGQRLRATWVRPGGCDGGVPYFSEGSSLESISSTGAGAI